ncbi:hypothetical protein [Shewanella gaetbuli]
MMTIPPTRHSSNALLYVILAMFLGQNLSIEQNRTSTNSLSRMTVVRDSILTVMMTIPPTRHSSNALLYVILAMFLGQNLSIEQNRTSTNRLSRMTVVRGSILTVMMTIPPTRHSSNALLYVILAMFLGQNLSIEQNRSSTNRLSRMTVVRGSILTVILATLLGQNLSIEQKQILDQQLFEDDGAERFNLNRHDDDSSYPSFEQCSSLRHSGNVLGPESIHRTKTDPRPTAFRG